MAFTATHIAKAMLHLNYPATQWAKTTIERQLNNVSAFPEIETEVIAVITELDSLQSDISTFTIDKSGVQVGSTGVVYFPVLAIAEKRSRYRLLQCRLASLTQLINYSYSGDRLSRG